MYGIGTFLISFYLEIKQAELHPECICGCSSPFLAIELVVDGIDHEGRCNARPTLTSPTTKRHLPLASTKQYCLVTEAHGYE